MNAPFRLGRRHFMASVGSALMGSVLAGSARAGTLKSLDLYGPPGGPSVTLAHAVATSAFEGIANTASFTVWRSPDELRAGLTSGRIEISVVPVQAAANLYNRGFPIRLANIMTDGILYVLARDENVSEIGDLAGLKVAVPFRGDTPEIIFNQLLRHNGLDPITDVDVTFTSAPIEALQLVLSGRVAAALTTEPLSTRGLIRAKMTFKSLHRAIDIQSAWAKMTGGPDVLPQAGLAVVQSFVDRASDSIDAIRDSIARATKSALADPQVAAGHASGALGLPAKVLAASLPNNRLTARTSIEAREDIERMLTAMAGPSFEKIGGMLPDDGFYI